MKKQRKWWILSAMIWMVLIFFFTQLPYFTGEKTSSVIEKVVETEQDISQPSSKESNDINVNILNLIVRKTTHVIVFGILAFLLFKSLEPNKSAYILSWFITFLYAITDEWHQSFMEGRVASFKDVMLDSFGAALVLLLVFLIERRKKRKAIC